AASPDCIIIDLEDAVGLENKTPARQRTSEYLGQLDDAAQVVVRINPIDTSSGLEDLVSISRGELRASAVALPKVESGRDIEVLRSHAGEDLAVCALIETARGLANLDQIGAMLRPGDALALGGF